MSGTQAPFVFIVGRGRSGTTLLRAMLSSHPQLAIPPESHFVVRMCRHGSRFGTGARFDAGAFADELLRVKRFDPWGLSADQVRSVVATAVDVSSAVRNIYQAYAELEGKPRYGDKTPSHVMHVAGISRWFPEARFVHIIRDGRDVALSYLAMPYGPNSIEEAAAYWERFVRQGRRDGRVLGPDKYLEVRYEELVKEPEATLRDICSLIDLPFAASMMDYWRRGDSWAPGEAHHANLTRPPTRGLRSWREEMSGTQVAAFEALAGGLLEELDYPLATGCSRLGHAARYLRGQWIVQGRRLNRHAFNRGWHAAQKHEA